MMTHLILTDLEDKKLLVTTEFMVAIRVKVKPQSKDDKIIQIQPIDATNLLVHDEFGILIKETPEEIYNQLQEISYDDVEGSYEGWEGDDDSGEADAEGLQQLPSPSP